MGESSKGIVVGILDSSRNGDGLRSVFRFDFLFLCRRGRLVRVGIATVTPRSLGVNGGRDLLLYHPFSQRACSKGDRIYPLQ